MTDKDNQKYNADCDIIVKSISSVNILWYF